jgi:hypothetical protein
MPEKPPNEVLISCKRPVKTYGPQPRAEAGARAEQRCARVCRLH